MCGICGHFVLRPDRRPDIAAVKDMAKGLRHRGPDETGFFSDSRVALGHTRLSIIDLSTGKQPLFNENRSICLVFNGEIYNFQDLRNRLSSRHRFQTKTDGEVILHLWEDMGERCVENLRGMFAFALYDHARGILFLARDRFGQKPLVYAETDSEIFFCSEITPLAAVPGRNKSLDPAALDDFLTFHYIPAPRTIYRHIRKLPAAHTLTVSDRGNVLRQYWALDASRVEEPTGSAAAAELQAKLNESVKLHMVADVPLGAFLSGGVDSSTIVALMRKQEPQRDIQTVCVGWNEADFDERPQARHIADRFQTIHHEYRLSPSVVEILPKLVRHYGEPFGDSSAVPAWHLCEAARRHVKVALSGDGGDEVFLGYGRYRNEAVIGAINAFPKWIRAPFLQACSVLIRLPLLARANLYRAFLQSAATPENERIFHKPSVFTPEWKDLLYGNVLRSTLQHRTMSRLLPGEWLDSSPLRRYQIFDISTYLPNDILTKVDIASMAHGLEVRPPLLDHELVEFAVGLPLSRHFRRFGGKRMLKNLGAAMLGRNFVRRKKRGFQIPIGPWMRGPLYPSLAACLRESPLYAETALFHPDAIQRLLQEHRRGTADHTDRLWDLWVLGEWGKAQPASAFQF